MIGVLGGTFDPIHFGHLRMAQELASSLRCQAVFFVPTGTPPHRRHPWAGARHRQEMVARAISSNPLFVLDDREIRRPGLSFTVETLEEIKGELSSETLALFVGADAWLAFPSWKKWQDIFSLAHVVVAHRPGFSLGAMDGGLKTEIERRLVHHPQALRLRPHGFIYYEPITALDISASKIRGELSQGRSPRYLLPDAVLDYLETHRLYTREERP